MVRRVEQGFSLDVLVEVFEKAAQQAQETGEVDVILFTVGMEECLKSLNAFGSLFSAAFGDLRDKVAIMKKAGPKLKTLNKTIEVDRAAGRAPPDGDDKRGLGASPTRCVNTMMHVCLLIAALFDS